MIIHKMKEVLKCIFLKDGPNLFAYIAHIVTHYEMSELINKNKNSLLIEIVNFLIVTQNLIIFYTSIKCIL